MNVNRDYPAVRVTEKCRRRTAYGHPWIYDNEIVSAEDVTDGELCDVISEKNRYIGTGFYNSRSKIRVRIISRNTNDRFDKAFFTRRLEYAWGYRKLVMPESDRTACRIVFGEADGFPGLTVDRFGDLLSVQILSLGIEKRKDIILPALLDILEKDGQRIRGVYLRNDVKLRSMEGMTEEKGWYYREGDVSPVTVITENGIKYYTDVENGQKTGFFLDQKYNRRAAAALARDRNILDICTHTGSFALNCAAAGAAGVTAVDVSGAACDAARKNAELNGLEDKISFVCADAFDFLEQRLSSHDRSADYIILDPPAFTKSGKTVGNAKNGYLRLNTLAMRLLPRGGVLATASCSHFMTEELFSATMLEAAKAAGVGLMLIEQRRQAPDHPILPAVGETQYLKFYLFRII